MSTYEYCSLWVQAIAVATQLLLLVLVIFQVRTMREQFREAEKARLYAAATQLVIGRLTLHGSSQPEYDRLFQELVCALKGHTPAPPAVSRTPELAVRAYWTFQWHQFQSFLDGLFPENRYLLYLSYRHADLSKNALGLSETQLAEYRRLATATVAMLGDDVYQSLFDALMQPATPGSDLAIHKLARSLRKAHWDSAVGPPLSDVLNLMQGAVTTSLRR